MLLRWVELPFSPMVTEILAGLLLVVFGLVLNRASSLLKAAQHQQIVSLWHQRGSETSQQQPDSSAPR